MKVVFLSPSLSRQAGGIFEIERCLAQALLKAGVSVSAHGLEDNAWNADGPAWQPVPALVNSIVGPKAFGYAPELYHSVFQDKPDLLHLHALWMFPSVVTRKWSRRTGRPYLVTPNGMLEPWALSNSALKKRIAGFLYENRMLHGAACLQANTEKELRDFRAYGLKNPICVIPNGIDVPEIDAQTLKTERLKSEKKILLFLGRLHPKKGLVNALKAWKQVLHSTSNIQNAKSGEWQFVVAGWDQNGHEADLKRLCDELGLSYADVPAAEFLGDPLAEQEHPAPLGKSATVIDTPLHSKCRKTGSPASVVFTGPAFGAAKDQLLRQASAFILPSFSEGLPMSVLEAWSYCLPVLMTDECNLPEGFAADAAIRIGTDAKSIAEGMRLLRRSPISDLQSLGDNGRQLVSERFTWQMVAAQMKSVYSWILGGGPKPEFVVAES